MASQSKAQTLNDIHTLLKKHYKPKPERASGRLTVLEAVVYGICHEGSTREQANQALSRFKDGFFDWNEVRVSSVTEIEEALAGFTDTENRAYRIRRFLRQLFEKTYGFNLEALAKKPLKESLKVLCEYETVGGSDYVEATVIQQSLGGHAMPVDAPARRALERLGIIEPAAETPAVRSLLERAVPKNRGVEFLDVLEDLAHDTCVDPIPDCPRCELRKLCPTAAARKEAAHAASKATASKEKAAAKPKMEEPVKGPIAEKEKAKSKDKPTPKAIPKASSKTTPPPPPAPPAPPAKPSNPLKKKPGSSK